MLFLNNNYAVMDISTKDAALRLQVSPQRVLVMLRDGQLTGRKVGSTWLVDEASVTARVALNASAGPPWTTKTTMRILDALSDQRPLAPRERALVQRLEPIDLATKIAQATTVRRYTTRWMEDVPSHLELTGESAIDRITPEPWQKLHVSFHAVHGYLRDAENLHLVERAARMVPDSEGAVFVYAFKGASFPWTRTPVALVATDCVRSTSTRVRSTGLTALREMREQWLQSIG